jgi:8-oxo-dGTP diphosphatase
MDLVESTLCLLVRGDPPREVLLGLKKRGFGAGKVTGFGGKVEAGETAAAAAVREVAEEIGVGLRRADLVPVGRLTFLFPARPTWSQVVHLFLASRWAGEPAEGAEMAPAWYPVDSLPLDRMWQDGACWLPRVLAGEQVRATFTFGPDNESVAGIEIEPHEA